MRSNSRTRLLLVLAVGFLAWYFVLRAAIVQLFPENDDAEIDTLATSATLVSVGPDILLYELDRLARPAKKRMVLVGSSNVMFSLRPGDLRPALQGWEIHNAALPRSNMQQIAQVVDMVLAVSDPETLKRTVFALGNYFLLYAQPQPLWGGPRSPLTDEMLRYGLYRSAGGADPTPVLGYGLAPVTKDLYRTVLGADALLTAVEQNTHRCLQGRDLDWQLFTGRYKYPYPYIDTLPSLDTQREHIERRARQIGTASTLSHEQFAVLERITQRIRRAGARLVIFEAPTPRWMRGPHYEFYRDHKRAFVQGLAQAPGVDYLDLVDALPDELMSGSTHPTRRGATVFAQAFSTALAGLKSPLP